MKACEEESSVVMANEETHERKALKSNDNESDYETSNQESKAVKNDKALKKKVKKGFGKCKMNQEKSSFIDEMHETLVSELKEELAIAMFTRCEEGCES